jgi:hypothetical protein
MGTYAQAKKGKQQEHRFELKYGKLMLQNMRLEKVEKVNATTVTLDNRPGTAQIEQQGTSVQVRLTQARVLERGQVIILVV